VSTTSGTAGAASIEARNVPRAPQRVDGVDGADYRIQCTVVTSAGDTLTLAAILPVRAKL
jgi:hypothetical protein